MARKKERVMAFDVMQPDTLHAATERNCRNFICFEKNVRSFLDKECRRESWLHESTRDREINTLLGYQTELRDGVGELGMDVVSLLPITLEKSVKTTTPYIYRTIDYGAARPTAEYGTRKDAIDLIQKRIKTKGVVMHYNGITERGDLDFDRINEILGGLEEDTIDFDIEPIGRGDVEGDMILVTIYKNDMKTD